MKFTGPVCSILLLFSGTSLANECFGFKDCKWYGDAPFCGSTDSKRIRVTKTATDSSLGRETLTLATSATNNGAFLRLAVRATVRAACLGTRDSGVMTRKAARKTQKAFRLMIRFVFVWRTREFLESKMIRLLEQNLSRHMSLLGKYVVR